MGADVRDRTQEAPWHLRWFYLATRLRDHFSEKQLIELGAQIAFEQHRARLNRLFHVASDRMNGAGRGGGPGCHSRAR